MAGILGGGELTPEERAANDRHRLPLVALVLLALLVVAWATTDLAGLAGVPGPRDAADALGLELPANLDWQMRVDLAPRDGASTERLVFFAGLALAFLASYFSPVAWKRHAIGILGLGLLFLLFGTRAAGLLTAALLSVYVTYHPRARAARVAAAGCAALVVLAASPAPMGPTALATLIAGAVSWGAFGLARPWLVADRAGRVARLALSQAALIASVGAIVLETVRSSPLAVPFGVLLFLWQWERLIFYAGDVEDGAVPDDLPLPIFLSVFASPPIVFAWARGFTVGQAYAYQDASFLAVDKNRLVLRGLALWALGFTYLLLSDAAVIALGDAAGRLLGTRVYTLFPELLERELGNSEVPAATVLASTFLSQLRWYLSKAGPMHFMVGSFRILGYDVAAHYDAPLLATNLVSLWARFTFHYREFLGRVFYYPVFLRLARWPMSVRIVLATFAAAGLGNWLWGHAVHASASAGMSGSAFLGTLRMWPYFLLLSAGISVTEVYLLLRGRKARKPWTPGWRLVLDVVAAYATFQFFGLIEIFFFSVKFPERSVTEHAALFLRAFGI